MRTPDGIWTWKIGTLVAAMAVGAYVNPVPLAIAADHAESTSVAGDPGADIADVYAFLDPTTIRRSSSPWTWKDSSSRPSC
jgi:hypothetical protein